MAVRAQPRRGTSPPLKSAGASVTKPRPPKAAPKMALMGINTWVRVRPLGDLGHSDGELVEKQLGSFDESCVKIVSHDQGGKETSYSYPSKVFPVSCSQEDVSDEVLPSMLEDFWSDQNVMIFAYGQTGTGKTTTMFGFPESLASESKDPGWGLLPRAVHATLQHNAARSQQGICSILLLSAVEFYCGLQYDLADAADKQMCTMKGHQVLGNTYIKCDSPAILKEFIERVYGNRQVAATKMNDGSSRSHCAIILTLLTLDTSSNGFRQTSFSIVDLAGAERPEKALGTRISKDKAVMEIFMHLRDPTKSELSPAAQGYLINFELFGLLSGVVGATNVHKAGREFKASMRLGGGALAFLGAALAGEARLGALICLSQSPQNGWETWFSVAQYGRKLAALRTRLKPVATVPMEAALAQAERAAEEAASALANAGTSVSNMKYQPFRIGMKVCTEQRLFFLRMLKEMHAV